MSTNTTPAVNASSLFLKNDEKKYTARLAVINSSFGLTAPHLHGG